MGLVPLTPNLPVKSWLSKPENKVAAGGAIVVAGAGAVGLYHLLPFMLSMLVDTFHVAILATGLFVFGYVILSNRFRTLFKHIYMSAMRKLTSLFVEIDPIGILKNKVSVIEERQAVLNQQTGVLDGSIRSLGTTIKANNKEADKALELASEAQHQAEQSKNPAQVQYLQAQVRNNSARAVRLRAGNEEFAKITVTLRKLYDWLIKTGIDTQAFIDDKKDVVRYEETRRKTLRTSYSAYHSVLRILKGNPVENEMEDMSMQFLADDADRMLGEMENIERMTADVLGNMDLERGIIDNKAMKALEVYEQKRFGPPATTPATVPAQQKQPAERTGTAEGSDYSDSWK